MFSDSLHLTLYKVDHAKWQIDNSVASHKSSWQSSLSGPVGLPTNNGSLYFLGSFKILVSLLTYILIFVCLTTTDYFLLCLNWNALHCQRNFANNISLVTKGRQAITCPSLILGRDTTFFSRDAQQVRTNPFDKILRRKVMCFYVFLVPKQTITLAILFCSKMLIWMGNLSLLIGLAAGRQEYLRWGFARIAHSGRGRGWRGCLRLLIKLLTNAI